MYNICIPTPKEESNITGSSFFAFLQIICRQNNQLYERNELNMQHTAKYEYVKINNEILCVNKIKYMEKFYLSKEESAKIQDEINRINSESEEIEEPKTEEAKSEVIDNASENAESNTEEKVEHNSETENVVEMKPEEIEAKPVRKSKMERIQELIEHMPKPEPLVVYANDKFNLSFEEYDALEKAIIENTKLHPVKTSKRLFFEEDIMYIETEEIEGGMKYRVSLKDFYFEPDEEEYKEIMRSVRYKEYVIGK